MIYVSEACVVDFQFKLWQVNYSHEGCCTRLLCTPHAVSYSRYSLKENITSVYACDYSKCVYIGTVHVACKFKQNGWIFRMYTAASCNDLRAGIERCILIYLLESIKYIFG